MKAIYDEKSPIVIQASKHYSEQRTQHRKLIRSVRAKDPVARDSAIFKNPASTCAKIQENFRW